MVAALATAPAVVGHDPAGGEVTVDLAHDATTILGGAGSGKTRLLLTLARLAAKAGDVLVWAADLTPTQALARELAGRVDWLATDPHTLLLQVQMASALARWRATRWAGEIALTDNRKLATCPTRPAVILLADIPTLAADTATEQAAYGGLARMLTDHTGVAAVPLYLATRYCMPGKVTKHAGAVQLRRAVPGNGLIRRPPQHAPWIQFTAVDPYTLPAGIVDSSGPRLDPADLVIVGPTYTSRSDREH